jgi:hypothetical protein
MEGVLSSCGKQYLWEISGMLVQMGLKFFFNISPPTSVNGGRKKSNREMSRET